MQQQEMNLNIRYDAPQEIWDKIPFIYSQLNGWLGFGEGGDLGEEGLALHSGQAGSIPG